MYYHVLTNKNWCFKFALSDPVPDHDLLSFLFNLVIFNDVENYDTID